VQLEVASAPGVSFDATVASIDPVLDAKTGTSTVHIRPESGATRLAPGTSARATIVTASRNDVLIAPRTSVVPSGPGRGPRVVALENGGASDTLSVRWIPVTVGLADAQSIEIISGLENGQLVATGAFGNLNDGDQVIANVVETSARTQPASSVAN
jgi:hypothetical protein